MNEQNLREEAITKGKELGLHLGYANKLEDFVDWFLSRTIPKEEVKRVVGTDKEFDVQSDGEYHFGENQKTIGINQERQRILSELGLKE